MEFWFLDLKKKRKPSFSVPRGISDLCGLIIVNQDGSLSGFLFGFLTTKESNNCVHLMTNPGFLMRAQNIQTAYTPW